MSRTEPPVRTQLSLQGISRLVEGTLDNPAQMLGPHAIDCGDRSALSVRAFLPSSERAWLVDHNQSEVRPMRRIHPSGFYEAICPAGDSHQAANY